MSRIKENQKDYVNQQVETRLHETIPLKQLSKAMQTALKSTNIVSPDSKVDVIRVTSQYRVIGKYLLGVYYVMSYDIDFTAYKH